MGDSPTGGSRTVTGRLHSITFPGPAGSLEGLWKDAQGERRGSAVFGHPHPLHGGTMHNKVVFRAVQALTRSGFSTLRFNFRGVGLSEGRYDGGRGEIDDFRAAMDEAARTGGLPLVAGGFSFGSAVGLKAIARDADPRASAFIALGLPLATESGRLVPRPTVPALLRGRRAGRLRAAGGSRAVRRRLGHRRHRAGGRPLFRGQPRVESATSSRSSCRRCPSCRRRPCGARVHERRAALSRVAQGPAGPGPRDAGGALSRGAPAAPGVGPCGSVR